ncbi:phosphoribosyltransferase family protein [uncultured Maribacter sp.]|uniref:ComF family protein n=1 Tax=uncultured Maribacter sp. TaxID=431308 RepID=UPI0030EEEA78|tara:strand:- start:75788 stop:76495 length:708 start_codon:yes stop_codon:yes gene_type:complete
MQNRISNILKDVTNILLPISCFGCNARLYRGEAFLCTSCRHQLPLTEYNFNEENAVDRIFYGRINIKKANSFLFFTEIGIVKNLIHFLKYKNQESIGEFLGDWHGQILKQQGDLVDIDYVIPVPLHRKKLRQRGYNQVALFAKQIAVHLNATYADDLLIKTANTKTQTKKNRLSRWQDNRSLYEINNKQLLKNKNILLVDDVITTGATMEICANTFKDIEGITIYISSMAVVPKA